MNQLTQATNSLGKHERYCLCAAVAFTRQLLPLLGYLVVLDFFGWTVTRNSPLLLLLHQLGTQFVLRTSKMTKVINSRLT